MPTKKPTISKREFAAQIGVGTKQVTRHIRNGRISGAALDHSGREVRIVPDVARQQLRSRLAPATSGRALTGGARLDDDTAPGDELNVKLKRELLRGLRIKNQVAELKAGSHAGQHVLTSEIDGLVKRTVETVLTLVEAEVPEFVAALSDSFRLPRGEVAALVADHMKEARRRAMSQGKGN